MKKILSRLFSWMNLNTVVKLKQRENKFQSIVDNLNVGISVISSDMRITAINKLQMKWFPNVNVDEKPVCYKMYNDPVRDSPCLCCPCIKTFKDGEIYETTVEISDGNGGIKYFRIHSNPIKDNDGNVTHVIKIMENITSRVQKDNEYKVLFDEVCDSIIVFDIETLNVLDCNIQATRKYGYTKEEFKTMNILALHPIPEHSKVLNNVNSKDPLVLHEYRHLTKSGSLFWVSINAREIEYKGRKAKISMMRDLTYQKNQELKIKLQTYNFELIAENISDIVWMMNLDMEFTYFSPSVYKLTGYTIEEAKNNKFSETVTKDSYKKCMYEMEKALDEVAEKGNVEPKDIVVEIIRKDGTIMDGEIQASFTFDVDNNLIGILGVTRDITQRKLMEDNLIRSQKMETTSTIAAGIAHDFNNILNIIFANSELAMKDIDKWRDSYQNLKEIKNAGQRASDIVKQFRHLNRKEDVARSNVNICRLVSESVKFLKSSLPSSININTLNYSKYSIVNACGTQITQVIMNLCINAAHAMEKTGGNLDLEIRNEIVTDTTKSMLPGKYLVLNIIDNGQGINDDDLGKIFEPYFTTKDSEKGTGLGLAVVNQIVDNHDGTIEVYSEEFIGTSFKIYLPLIEKFVKDIEDDKQERIIGNETIMFVDDEKSLVKASTQLLTAVGFTVVSFTDPTKALQEFRINSNKYDVIITDMTMPGLTGDILAQEIKKINSKVPIILCSGTFIESSSYVDLVLSKPILSIDLGEAIKQIVI